VEQLAFPRARAQIKPASKLRLKKKGTERMVVQQQLAHGPAFSPC
jgi:hypothetical protein